MTTADELARERIEAVVARFIGRDPRWRYLQDDAGRMFLWTTERMGAGKFASAVLIPYGPGSRSGRSNVTRWRTVREVHHRTRTAAKARARRLWKSYQ